MRRMVPSAVLPAWKWERPLGAIIPDPGVPEVEFGHEIWRKQLLVVPRCLFNQKLLTCALWTSLMAVSFFHFSYSFIRVTNIDQALLCMRNRGESSMEPSTTVPAHAPLLFTKEGRIYLKKQTVVFISAFFKNNCSMTDTQ